MFAKVMMADLSISQNKLRRRTHTHWLLLRKVDDAALIVKWKRRRFKGQTRVSSA